MLLWKKKDGNVHYIDLIIDDRIFEMDRSELWRIYTIIENSFNETWLIPKQKKQNKTVKQLRESVIKAPLSK